MGFLPEHRPHTDPKGLILITGTWAGSFPGHHALKQDSPALLGTRVHTGSAKKKGIFSIISEIYVNVKKWAVRSTNLLWESDSMWHTSECVDKHHKIPSSETQDKQSPSVRREFPELAASLSPRGSYVCRP